MATEWTTISKENTNFARLCKVLIDGGTRALRYIFDNKINSDLKKHLMDRRNHHILKQLRTRRIIRPEQWNKLYPSAGMVTSANFDITLLSLLLRNICNLPTPANGWDKTPAETSLNVEDDLVRLRLYRNKLGHISEPALSEADFNKYWNDIKTVLLRLGADMTAIDSLRTQSMDPEDEEYYNECLKEWAENEERLIKELKEKVENIERKLEEPPSKRSRATCEDMDLYSRNLKEAIIKQTELHPKEIIKKSVKTDDIFTNLVVHHGNEKCSEQIESQDEDHPRYKTLNEIKQCADIFVGEDGKDTTAKIILLSGEPGIGKTLFSHKLLRDLATNSISIPDINLTYLITFRQLNNLQDGEKMNLKELLNLCPLMDEKTRIDDFIIEYIIQHPKQFFVVLDGFDECKNREKIAGDFESQFPNDCKIRMPVAALIGKLIRKKIFSDSVTMVTSRPGEANELDQKIHFDRYVEISGFSEQQVIEYVDKYFSARPEEVKNMALSKVKGSEHYISFGMVPFRCFLMCVYIEWEIQNNQDNLYPASLTEFYCQVLRCIERHYNRAILRLDDKDACLAVNKVLDNFAKLAEHLSSQNRFSFTSEDLENLEISENEIKGSNLIYSYLVFGNNLPFQKPTCEYSFTHYTIQEFFFAQSLVKKGAMVEQETTDMVYIFMSGLLGIIHNDELMLKLLECVLAKYEEDEYRLRLVSLRCLYEYGRDKRLTREELSANRDDRYWNSDWVRLHDVTDTDCGAIAMLLESTDTSVSPPQGLYIGGSILTSYGLNTLLPSLTTQTCSITGLRFWSCELDDECAERFGKYLPDTKITVLILWNNKISDVGVKHIMNHLPNNLTELNLSNNRISDDGVNHIMEHLTNNLTELRLSRNPVSDECRDNIGKSCERKYPGLAFYI